MTEATENPTSAPDPWLPDLWDTPLGSLDAMDLTAARARVMAQAQRGTANIAGSDGS